ncbi:MAG: type III pantothenate kinase [Bacilli bacterium]
MNNLVIDIGNSNIVIGIYTSDVKVYRFNTDSSKTSDEYYNMFINSFKDIKIDNVLISSVVPSLTNTIKYCFENRFNIIPKIVSPGYKSGIKVMTDNPKEVGSDLICGVSGASKYSPSGIVIDLGTATKISYYKDKVFKGVIIAPGIQISARTLSNSASQLSEFSLQKPERIFGKNTVECLQSGIIYGHIAMLNGLIKMIEKELGKKLDIYLTGGLSYIVKNDVEFKFKYDPNLILDALNQMIVRNEEC